MNTTLAVKQIMSEKHISQKMLAESLGFKYQTAISERLRGSNMGTENLIKMLNALGYSLVARDNETGAEIELTVVGGD